MNIFVLNTGRCGSVTFSKACEHITNYTIGHESRIHDWRNRLAYPDNHIEVDNRLSWFLGGLEKFYGDQAIYVHLLRDTYNIARSFVDRWDTGIIRHFTHGILPTGTTRDRQERLRIAKVYVQTVNQNIAACLEDKTSVFTIQIEQPQKPFVQFWQAIEAQGNIQQALAEFQERYNHG